MAAARVQQKRQNVAVTGLSGKGGTTTCAQRIESVTVRDRKQVVLTEVQVLDAEALFRAQDTDGTGLLSRGSLTEALRMAGLEEKLGEQSFRSTVRLAFDAHSADSHFLSLAEFKQLYYLVHTWHPELLPRRPLLKIFVMKGTKLPALDINGKSDPFCAVQLIGKPRSKMQTRHIDKTLDPVWNEELDDRFCYEEGDTLEFIVQDFDKGSRCELIGKAQLPSSEFHKEGGFEGELKLSDLPRDFKFTVHPSIHVRVLVTAMQPELQTMYIKATASKARTSLQAAANMGVLGAAAGLLGAAAVLPGSDLVAAATSEPNQSPAAPMAPAQPAAGGASE